MLMLQGNSEIKADIKGMSNMITITKSNTQSFLSLLELIGACVDLLYFFYISTHSIYFS